MTNTVHGPFSAINVVNGSTPANATWANNAQTQADAALHGFNPDLIGSGFVLSGVTCAKDGTVANQLDIASGRAYVVLSDGTLGLIVVGTDNTHTTATPSTTYHLYLQPDGTWYWNTANSPAANSLWICDVATDGSGNISAVTDKRTLTTTLLSGAAGLGVPKLTQVSSQATVGSFGVPVIVAQALRTVINVTNSQSLLSVAAPANGLYRLSVGFDNGNGTAGNLPKLQGNWNDTGGFSDGQWFVGYGGGTGIVLLDGSHTFAANAGAIATLPLVFQANTGRNISVTYQTSGTPNDTLSVLLERLA